jgi:class 3 adenylate cyclase
MREERKVVTALFADLVGSTSLAEALDPEEAKLIVGEAIARMVRAVEEFGGTVKDLAGDGMLALFGAPVSHEDDPERAIRTGLRIVHDVGDYGAEVARAWGVPELTVRVGLNTGPVVLGPVGAGQRVEYAAYGDTVNTSARLQAAAGPGTVLVGTATHRLVEPLFDWTEPQSLRLKGKADVVVAYGVRAALTALGKPRGIPGVQAHLVGRERELGIGREAVDGILAGRGGILFISGEAGIGKSRLLVELRTLFRQAAAATGRPLWLEGRCVSYGEALPYWPFRDLLREWLGAGAQEPELRVRIALRRNVERLFGDRALAIYPYLGSMLGIAMEPDATARLAELSSDGPSRTTASGTSSGSATGCGGPTASPSPHTTSSTASRGSWIRGAPGRPCPSTSSWRTDRTTTWGATRTPTASESGPWTTGPWNSGWWRRPPTS